MKVRELRVAVVRALGADLRWSSEMARFTPEDTIQGQLANQVPVQLNPSEPDPWLAHVERVAKELEGDVIYKEWETFEVSQDLVF